MTIKSVFYANGSNGVQGKVGQVDKKGKLKFGLDADVYVRKSDYRRGIESTVQVGGIRAGSTDEARVRAAAMMVAADLADKLEARVKALEASGLLRTDEGEDWKDAASRAFRLFEAIAEEFDGLKFNDDGSAIEKEEAAS